jgi:molecular chaperone HscB
VTGPDPFVVLGLPRRFALEPAELDRRWRACAREVHPDRLARATPADRARAEAAATQVNDARRLLAGWTERALVLVSATAADLPHLADPAFLAAQLDAREALAALRGVGDAAGEERFAAGARAALAALEREVAGLFGAQDAGGAAVDRDAVLDRLARARFHQALLAEAGRGSTGSP